MMVQKDRDTFFKGWTNGNGLGTEKWDAFSEIAFDSKTQDEFNESTRQPFLASMNAEDSEPVDQNAYDLVRKGFQQVKGTPYVSYVQNQGKYADYWKL